MFKIVQAVVLASLIFSSNVNNNVNESFVNPAPVIIEPYAGIEEIEIDESELARLEADTDLYLSSVATQVEEEPVVEQTHRREVTDEEYKLLLRVCMSETGGKYGEPIEGKVAVVETILNRVDMGQGSIKEVITAPNQYSMADNGEPDETVVEAVELALTGDAYPDDMLYFRTKRYHKFGTPYKKIGNHYFSCK